MTAAPFGIALAVALAFTLAGTAHGDKVRTNQAAKIYNRPGEQGRVLVKLGPGRAMTVLEREGRWLKVRVAGRTGYIPRSKVDAPQEDGIARNTRRRPFVDGRGTKRGFGGNDTAPDDRIGADATGDTEPVLQPEDTGEDGGQHVEEPAATPSAEEPEEDAGDDRVRTRLTRRATLREDPDAESTVVAKASPSDVLYVLEREGRWTLVETEDGDAGYVESSALAAAEEADGESVTGATRARTVTVGARLGVMLLGQDVSTRGGGATWPDDYTLGSSAAAVSLDATVVMPYKRRFVLGIDVSYDLGKAVPGITFDPDKDGPAPAGTTGFTRHVLDARAIAGYELASPRRTTVYARLGVHYESFLVSDYADPAKNTGQIPSEVAKGPTVGVAVSIPRLTPRLALHVAVDAILAGASVEQTVNLEDGADPSLTRIGVGASVTYRWKPALHLQLAYDLHRASYDFGAPVPTSMRMHTGTGVARTDLGHTIGVGVAKSF